MDNRDRNRRIVALCHEDKATFAEAAQHLGVSRSTIAGVMRRFRQGLLDVAPPPFLGITVEAALDDRAELRRTLLIVRRYLQRDPLGHALLPDLKTGLLDAVNHSLAVTEKDVDSTECPLCALGNDREVTFEEAPPPGTT